MTQAEIYSYLKRCPGQQLTATEIAEGIGVKTQAVRYFCKRLVVKGCVERQEYGTRHVYRYWISNGNGDGK